MWLPDAPGDVFCAGGKNSRDQVLKSFTDMFHLGCMSTGFTSSWHTLFWAHIQLCQVIYCAVYFASKEEGVGEESDNIVGLLGAHL